MSALVSLENKLNELLVTKSPVTLPKEWRKWMATYAWVFALIGCVLGVISVIILLPALGLATGLSAAVGAGNLAFFAWVSMLVLIGYTAMLAIAVPKLKLLQKEGWNLIFYSSLFFSAYDVFNWIRFNNFTSIFGLIWNLFWALVGLFFIFQMRVHFLGKAEKPEKSDAKPAAKKK